jgi:CubicO group peptidase (beta-lactamase class C family)
VSMDLSTKRKKLSSVLYLGMTLSLGAWATACALTPAHAESEPAPIPTLALTALPAQAADVPWPTQTWPRGATPLKLEQTLQTALGPTPHAGLENVRATLVVQKGKIIAEAYKQGFSATTQFPSWSMAKSVTHALMGILVRDGQLALNKPAPIDIWQRASNDLRAEITLNHLLRMQSGLAFEEVYDDPTKSHALPMLFGIGRLNTGGYAASLPITYAPGTHWSYSSGTSNILGWIMRRTLSTDRNAQASHAFMEQALLSPIGIRNAVPEFDRSGSFIGSSYIHMTAQDWARFGLLYLRNGVWDGQKILPDQWVNHARTLTDGSDGQYGAHFWLNALNPKTGKAALSDRIPTDAFMARGYGGQVTLIVPSLDMIVVMLGATYDGSPEPLITYMADVIAAATGTP